MENPSRRPKGNLLSAIARASAFAGDIMSGGTGLLLGSFLFLVSAMSCNAYGTWTTMSYPPDYVGHIMLLPDGTVFASQDYAYGSDCYRLTPDIHGSYVNGTWSQRASMRDNRLYYSSAVLKDGRLFVAGGEYGTGPGHAEIYNLTNDTWTDVSPPSSSIPQSYDGFKDSECKVLPDGKVLIFPAGPSIANSTLLYNPASNQWSVGASTLGPNPEAGAVKLPDGSLVMVDTGLTSVERYSPATNGWGHAGNTSVNIWASLTGYYGETGPGFLLPNGQVVWFGGSGYIVVGSPAGGWAYGQSFPYGQVAADAPGAMMPNGKILIASAPAPYVTNGGEAVFPGPTTFYEYDYTYPSSPLSSAGYPPNTLPLSEGSYIFMFLDLPDGSVMVTGLRDRTIAIYQPDGSPLAAGKPTILSIAQNSDGSFHLTGTLFNGISEGAAYGDDHQMNTDFPLVRFIDPQGRVRYGRTYNWTGTTVMSTNVTSTECTLPAGASPTDLIQVVVNGIASDAVTAAVMTTNDSGFGSLRQVLNMAGPGAIIPFATNLSGQTITLTNGELLLSNNVTIDASGLPGGITVNGNGVGRVFNVPAGTTALLRALAITNGYAGAGRSGGAITNSGSLTLRDCTLAGNIADSTAAAGAIWNSGSLQLFNCTLSGNSAGSAGAIRTANACTLQNCTVCSNTASVSRGGGIDNVGGTLTLVHCTLVGNSAGSAGGGIDNYFSQLNVTNTIVAGNAGSTGQDIYNWDTSVIYFGGSNIVQSLVNAVGGVFGSESIIAANPLLGPLTNNGGFTATLLAGTNSPAFNAAVPTSLTTDQRDYPRVVGPAPDIGAVEFQDVMPLVTTTNDSGPGSLRYVSTYCPPGTTITFANNLAGQTIGLYSEILLSRNVNVDASALAGGLTLDGGSFTRIFEIGSGVTVTLTSLTLVNGFDYGTGAAILNGGNLTVNQCLMWNNGDVVSLNSTLGGGAIYNQSGANLTVNQSTLTGNATGSYGGAIFNYGTLIVNQSTLSSDQAALGGSVANMGTGRVTLNQSTLAGNSAYYYGGGLYNESSNLIVAQSTISGNGAGYDGNGIYNALSSASFILDDSIVGANYGGPGADVSTLSVVTVLHSNIVTSLYGNTTTAPVISADPLLAPLGNYGGPTATMPPLPGSPAIDDEMATSLAFDQRNYPRPLGLAPDIGAVEGAYNSAGPGRLSGFARLGNGSIQISFTNVTDCSFTVLTSSNLALPLNLWSAIGVALESPAGSGKYQFIDSQATNNLQRFYRVKAP